MSFLLPVQRLRETPSLLAFHHPHPAYPFHVLIVPRRGVRGIQELDTGDQAFMHDLFETVQQLVVQYRLSDCGYRLVCNGGPYQEIEQLHFHLISQDYSPPV